VTSPPDRTRVACVVTTYRRDVSAIAAVESVLAQTHRSLEIVVVEDGGDAGIREWVERRGDPDLRYVAHAHNRGLAAARNTGMAETQAEWVAFLDDDDLWKPRRIAAQVERLSGIDEDVAVITCGLEGRSPAGELLYEDRPSFRGSLRADIRAGLKTIPSGGLYRRKAWEAIGGFDTDLATGIDHDIWMQLARAGFAVDYVDELLVVHVEDGRPRMTLDGDRRLEGIERFLEKWRPSFVEWLGEPAARRFVRRYRARTLGTMALALARAGQRRQARRRLFQLLRHHPQEFLTSPRYAAALVAGDRGLDVGRRIKSAWR